MARRRDLISEVYESETVWTRAYLTRDSDGGAASVSDFTAWGLWVYDTADYGLVYSVSDQAPSDGYFYDTLQTSGWDGDEAGYNFGHPFAPSDYAMLGERTYRMEYRLTTRAEGQVVLPHTVSVRGLYSV